MKNKILLAIALLICIPNLVWAQDEASEETIQAFTPITTGVSFLTVAPDARGGGMGDVGGATTPDADAQYWNPSKYAFINAQIRYADVGVLPVDEVLGNIRNGIARVQDPFSVVPDHARVGNGTVVRDAAEICAGLLGIQPAALGQIGNGERIAVGFHGTNHILSRFFFIIAYILRTVKGVAGTKKDPVSRVRSKRIRKIRVTLDRIFLYKHDQGSLIYLGI